MINEQKEKNVLTKMSDLEYSKNDVEMMRYRTNKIAYALGLGGMAFSMLACFFELNSISATSAHTIVVIMLNIIILLGGFLGVEKTKSYSKAGCISMFVFAGINFARIFYMPRMIISNFDKFMKFINNDPEVDQDTFDKAKAFLSSSVTTSYSESQPTSSYGYFFANGTARGVITIIFLVLSVGLFVGAGVIGYLRSRKLSNYLTSIGSKM